VERCGTYLDRRQHCGRAYAGSAVGDGDSLPNRFDQLCHNLVWYNEDKPPPWRPLVLGVRNASNTKTSARPAAG